MSTRHSDTVVPMTRCRHGDDPMPDDPMPLVEPPIVDSSMTYPVHAC